MKLMGDRKSLIIPSKNLADHFFYRKHSEQKERINITSYYCVMLMLYFTVYKCLNL